MHSAFCRCFPKYRSDPPLIYKVLISPNFPSKTVMNGAICTLLSWQNTPILLLGRQKAADNNRRIWQFKRSIKATQRLTIKAVGPFKDGSKDPFATLLFWRIELYKFRVKESCFPSLFGLGLKKKILIQFPSGIFMTRVFVTCEWQSEECRRASSGEEQTDGKGTAGGFQGTGIPVKRSFLERISANLPETTPVIILVWVVRTWVPPLWCNTFQTDRMLFI